jgi:hypothetical protein
LTTGEPRAAAMRTAIRKLDEGIGLFEVGLLNRPLDVLVPEGSSA